MQSKILDGFNTPDSTEWRHLRHSIRRNIHPTGPADVFLVWDAADQCVEHAPSLQAACRLIELRS